MTLLLILLISIPICAYLLALTVLGIVAFVSHIEQYKGKETDVDKQNIEDFCFVLIAPYVICHILRKYSYMAIKSFILEIKNKVKDDLQKTVYKR